ncbi:hypothetical protein NLG97_g8833 [Lecanicillium saksenae]|uniref:Uncharacterized protein n=1 Tax=Lecanicillium saksenae TaxID=468837 RepID=A0ACC1QJ63_9HYPO|nr:hypothetical protein NLG97_g8833 [Lecanicillium saksenae]
MPRPDLKLISVEYRRIPVVAIGRDPRLGGTTPEHKALEGLLSAYMNDRGMFGTMALLVPEDLPLMKDPNFVKDQDDSFASPDYKWDPQSRKYQRPASLQKMADMFTLFEETLLADGRTWVLGTQQPNLADIETVWLPNFILEIPGALLDEHFNAKAYPHVFAWIDRFRAAVDEAKTKNKPRSLSGEEAASEIIQAKFHEGHGMVDAYDFEAAALGLKKGDTVTVGPTDFGSSCRDVGRLVSLRSQEEVIEAQAGESTVRIHAPRQQYSIVKS